jgi:hypothetical protein
MGIGLTLSCVAMIGLRFLDVGSSYNAIWPFYLMLGAGIALTLPSASAAAMGAIDPRKAGIGSGVLNAARQVGGALGIAILGSVSTAITDRSWTAEAGAAGGALQQHVEQLRPLVEGAQIRIIGELIAQQAPQAVAKVQELAAEAWMDGFHASVTAGAAILGIGVVVVIVGFRGVDTRPHAPRGDAADMPPAPAEL